MLRATNQDEELQDENKEDEGHNGLVMFQRLVCVLLDRRKHNCRRHNFVRRHVCLPHNIQRHVRHTQSVPPTRAITYAVPMASPHTVAYLSHTGLHKRCHHHLFHFLPLTSLLAERFR